MLIKLKLNLRNELTNLLEIRRCRLENKERNRLISLGILKELKNDC